MGERHAGTHAVLLSGFVAFACALGSIHDALPWPYQSSAFAEAACAAVVALIIVAASSQAEGYGLLRATASVVMPLLLACFVSPSHRPALWGAAAALSVSVSSSFWGGNRHSAGGRVFWLALLGLTLLCSVHIGLAGAQQRTPQDADAFYYYGLARHWLATGEMDDHLVWHFLTRPAFPHPVGDYWQPGTSAVAAVSMLLFGPTYTSAVVGIGAFSALGSVGFWHLICGRGVVRSRVVQLVFVLAYSTAPELERFRTDIESQSVVSTLIVLSLLAMTYEAWAALALCCLALLNTRADAVLPVVAIGVGGVWASGPRRWRLVAYLCLVGVAYVSSFLLRFSTFGPPAGTQAPLLATYDDLYRIHPQLLDPGVRLDAVRTSLGDSIVASIAVLVGLPFVITRAFGYPTSLLGAGALPGDATLRPPVKAAIGTAIVIATIVPALLHASSGPVFNLGRTCQGLVSAMTLASAYGTDRFLANRRLPSGVVVVLSTALIILGVASTPVAQPRTSQRLALCVELDRSGPLLRGRRVLTNLPWWVAAQSDAAAVLTIPLDADTEGTAFRAVVDRFEPDLLILDPSLDAALAVQSLLDASGRPREPIAATEQMVVYDLRGSPGS